VNEPFTQRSRIAMSTKKPILFGYPPSTFTQTAALALFEKGVEFDFSVPDVASPIYRLAHPFGKVPALQTEASVIFETLAIAVYVDECFEGPRLQPAGRPRYDMLEWISVFLDYFHEVLVRGIIFEVFVKPMLEQKTDSKMLAANMERCGQLLARFEERLGDKDFLVSAEISIADLFFAPPLNYLLRFPEGNRLLSRHAATRRWLERISARLSFQRLAELDLT
jgi:glutathione S-transferase